MLEGRGRGHADEQHGDADVHDVAAVATAVAPHERQQRQRRRLARHRAPRARAAEELLPDAAEHERRTAEHRDRERLLGDAGDASSTAQRRSSAHATGTRKLRRALASVARRQAITGPMPLSSTRISASGTV